MDTTTGQRIIALGEQVNANFTEANWNELGLLTSASDIINGHHRLLRSLSWNDSDYHGNVLDVLQSIVQRDVRLLPVIESYVDRKFPGESHYISVKPVERKITFAPHVFQVPDCYVEPDLAAVMMPFGKEFDTVYAAIRNACKSSNLRCLRADDIWEDATIIQDVFTLIFRAHVVIVDFSTKNPNVMYETGIAHTLGKYVVPITQSLDDVPFDMRHHRTLTYLRNGEGFRALESALANKLSQFGVKAVEPAKPAPAEDDDIPF